MMVDQRIVRYIRNGLQKGQSTGVLRAALLRQGWNPQEIQNAFSLVRGQATQTPAAQQGSQKPASRPTGITLISIFGLIVSILSILGGLLIVGLGSLVGGLGSGLGGGNETFLGFINFGDIGLMLVFLGIIPLVLGIIGVIAFILLLMMKRVGLFLSMVVATVSIIMGIISFSPQNLTGVIMIVLWAIIAVYLVMKRNLFA